MNAKPATAEPAPYEPVLTRLRRLHPRVIDLSLDRICRLLARLGHPERALPPVIHVAGTNGKGSTIAYMRAILQAAGKKVHVYTSPHLVRFNERFVLANGEISDTALVDLLDRCEAANGTEPITEFEIITAAALLAFAETPADVLLLETGLGGRLDATNVIEQPALCVITPVSLDHQQFLGDTLSEIALEKAGILKPGIPAVVTTQASEVTEEIATHAARVGAPLFQQGKDWWVTANAQGFTYSSGSNQAELPWPNLPGAHQLTNAGAALAALSLLAEIPTAAVATDAEDHVAGLASARWPARLQRLQGQPYASLLPAGAELWLDGGHNPAAAVAMTSFLRQRAKVEPRPTYLVAAVPANKDLDGFLSPFAELPLELIAVPMPPTTVGYLPTALLAHANKLGLRGETAGGIAGALRAIAARNHTGAPRVLICGSLYLAGAVLAESRQ